MTEPKRDDAGNACHRAAIVGGGAGGLTLHTLARTITRRTEPMVKRH
jgi:hypothetical protein